MIPVAPHPRDGSVAVITLDNPPVNALSFSYCARLIETLEAAHADDAVQAVVFTGANGLFSAGADVNDFNRELPRNAVTIRDVIAAIEASVKVHVAAIDGNCLGGGFELSLACDYRVATPAAKLGLPEIKLGLLPGAGGTQRLPRLIGARAALEFMLKGSSISAQRALELGILDEVVPDVVERSATLAKGPKRRVSERQAIIAKDLPPQSGPYVVAQAHKMAPPEENGGFAAHKLIDAVQASIELPFSFGVAREARLFDELVRSAPSQALRHIFFAERELAKVPGLPDAAPQDVAKVGVVGAGTMGSGIAIAFAQAGIPVVVVDNNDDAVDKARQTVMGMFMYQVQKGRLTQERPGSAASRFVSPTTGASSPMPMRSSKRSTRISTSSVRFFANSTTSPSPVRFSLRTHPRSTLTSSLQRRSDPIGSRACTSSFRPTSCRCSRSFAARRRRRRRSQPPSRSARGFARRPCCRGMHSGSSETG